MAPSKSRVSRKKGPSSTNPTPNRNKRAGSKKLSHNQFSDNQTLVDIQQTISKKIDALLHVVTHLTMRVSVFEERQDQGEASVISATDKEEKLNFRRALVWHPASTSLSAPPMNRGRTRQHSHKPPSEYHARARSGTKACQAYNTL